MAASSSQRIFMTGANGYVGSRISRFAIEQGYSVHGLVRSETGAQKLRQLGAEPVMGDLTSLDVIRRESAEADIVISLASAYNVTSPSYESVMHIDNAALDAMADGLEGTGKPLVTTSGTLMAGADPNGGEVDERAPPDPSPANSRKKNEDYGLTLATRGICVTVVRLAAFVYGHGGSGIGLLMKMAADSGQAITVDGSKNGATYVHVDDAARLYLLVAQKAKTGEIFNAAGGNDMTVGQVMEAIANMVHVPVKNLSFEEADPKFGMLAAFLKAGNRASGAKAKRELGWEVREVGLLEDIQKGSYKELAEKLLKQSDKSG